MSFNTYQDVVNSAEHMLRQEAIKYSENSDIDFGSACAELVFHTIMAFNLDTHLTEQDKKNYCDRLRVLCNAQIYHGIMKKL